MNKTIKIPLIVIAITGILVFILLGRIQPTHQLKFLSMNTEVDILVYDKFNKNVDKANEEIFNLFYTLDSLWNPYDSNSEITAINNNAGYNSVKVNKMSFELIKTAIYFNQNISSNFNIAIGPLVSLWKKSAKQNKIPCDCMVSAYKKRFLDNKNIILDSINQTVFLKQRDMKLDFGAIAKGFAQKEVIKIMKKNKIKYFIGNSGGDMFVSSKYFRSFAIGIKNPKDKNAIKKIISVKNSGVATSGDYERFYIIENKQFSHIINPQTGFPAKKTTSSTVIHSNPLMADIWATTLSINSDDTLLKKLASQKGKSFLINKE